MPCSMPQLKVICMKEGRTMEEKHHPINDPTLTIACTLRGVKVLRTNFQKCQPILLYPLLHCSSECPIDDPKSAI